jgi:alpha-galactosidase
VEKCRQNGQEAGIYWAPFTYWGGDDSRVVEGGNGTYKYRDVYLYANGQKQIVDGAPAVDPTHPAVKARAKYYIDRFKEAGFTYIKLDFLGHGALEADDHFDAAVTTGIQAYNVGMKHMLDLIGGSMFVNESIAPLFPSNYAHSRRIACDTFSSISETEYALNSLTYGWWLSYAYSFNDADHIVLAGKTEGENRARVTSSAITGIFITGDDFSNNANPEGKNKAKKFLTNADINNMAKIKKSFMPVEGNTNDKASNLYVSTDVDNNRFYLAAFNFGSSTLTKTVDFSRIGFNNSDSVFVKELWSGKVKKMKGSITINVTGRDAEVYLFSADSLNDTSTGGLVQFINNNIKLFPNPASGFITAQTNNNIESIDIFSIEGKQAINIGSVSENMVKVNLSGLETGLYFVKITDDDGNSSYSKFIKAH